MIKIFKVSFTIVTFSLLLGLLSSCRLIGRFKFEYTGDYPELYTVAIHTMPGVRGYTLRSSGTENPFIRVLEEDNFGRVLFQYGDSSTRGTIFVIMQKATDEYVYFYPFYNHVIASSENSPSGFNARVDARNELKLANSWDRDMSDDSELDRVRIVLRKSQGSMSGDELMDIYHTFFPEVDRRPEWIYSRLNFMRFDRYGRSVYHATSPSGRYAIVFQPDHAFDIETSVVELVGDDYQTDLRLLMEANGWNTPPQG